MFSEKACAISLVGGGDRRNDVGHARQKICAISSVGRAARLHREGREFKSLIAHKRQRPPESFLAVFVFNAACRIPFL